MHKTYLVAFLASLLFVSACGPKPDGAGSDSHANVKTSTTGDSTGGMKIPATTTSDSAREHYMAGWAAFEMARNNVANEHFDKAVKADPAFAMAHLMKALSAASTEGFVSSLGKAGEHAAAATRGEQLVIEAYQKALDSDQAGQLAAVKELVKVHADSPRAWLFLGIINGNQNNTAEAIAALNKAVDLDPGFAAGHMQLGNTYMFLEPKDFDKAEAHIKKAVAIAPDEPNPHDLLGDVHRAQGNLKAAYDDYTKAAELAPEFGSPLQQRGHVNSFLGNFDAARADYSRAAELETARGSNAGPFFLIFRSYVNLHEGNHNAAISELKEIAASADSSGMEGALDLKIQALTNIAQIATHYGDAEMAGQAIADVSVLMRQQADDIGTNQFRNAQEANISFLEGMLAARIGSAGAAKEKADAFKAHVATSTNPRKLERMHQIMGMADFYQENYAGAAEHLSSADVVNNVATKYHLALAYENSGNAEKAGQMFEELAVWNFNGPGYAMNRKDILARASSR